ncbi:MAG: KEOPS complex kinase/ATPase Bud32 [Candidatus Diapherotrites archaeon]|nr:KEOPS complex kinase/ATPase Bud32 [Candidatus Diapherotrites archaeon]
MPDKNSEQFLRLGAEAKIFETDWHGISAIKKVRIRKEYRHKKLDDHLALTRARKEIALLNKVKMFGVMAPFVLDYIQDKRELFIEKISGKKAKDCLQNNKKLCNNIAKSIALMHNNCIIHGDLTADNILVKEEKPFFIDFGLGFYSSKIEDKATDLVNFKKSLLSFRPELTKEWQFIEKAYARSAKDGCLIIKKMRDISSRARYVT